MTDPIDLKKVRAPEALAIAKRANTAIDALQARNDKQKEAVDRLSGRNTRALEILTTARRSGSGERDLRDAVVKALDELDPLSLVTRDSAWAKPVAERGDVGASPPEPSTRAREEG